MGKRILMIVTSCDRIEEGHFTGLWLEEFAVPWLAFRRAGHAVSVTSVRGGKAPIDPQSEEGVKGEWQEARLELEDTVPLSAVAVADHDAVFIPGGHGTMFDMPENRQLQMLLAAFAAAEKPVAAVCHGPSALIGVIGNNGEPLVSGRRLTSFTNSEEREVGLDEKMPFLLEDRLRRQGADFVIGDNWQEHVEVDGALVTGQNPQSSAATANALIDALAQ